MVALVMMLSVMTVGIVSVGAKPTVPVILDDLPEWEWIIETPTGDYVDMLDEPAQEDMTVLGYTSNKTISEDIDTVKIKLYHYDWDNPNWNPRENDPLVLEKEVSLSGLSGERVATYTCGYRDDNAVYQREYHSLEFYKTSRKFSIPYSIPSRGGGYSVVFINKKFMDNLYRDQIVEECGESLSFAEWMDRSSNSRYELSILVSKDGETWYKLYPMIGVKATVVGGDTYSIESRTLKYWDYSIPHLGAKYWMLTEGFSQDSSTKIATPTKPLATGTITWYDYGDDFDGFSGTPTDDDFYNAYINAPNEYKTDSINARTGAFMLNTPESETSGVNYITQSGSSEQSIVTLDYDTANLRVTVPTVLPVSVDSDNNVTVSDNAKIVNNSKGQVDVTNAVLSGSNSWTLAEFDTDFTKVPVNTKQYGFKLQGYSVPIEGNAYNNQFATIDGNSALDLSYDANVAIQSDATTDAEIGNIIFTVAWHK